MKKKRNEWKTNPTMNTLNEMKVSKNKQKL